MSLPPHFSAAVLIAFSVFLAKVGSGQRSRYLTPYFPLLLALVLRRPEYMELTEPKAP